MEISSPPEAAHFVYVKRPIEMYADKRLLIANCDTEAAFNFVSRTIRM